MKQLQWDEAGCTAYLGVAPETNIDGVDDELSPKKRGALIGVLIGMETRRLLKLFLASSSDTSAERKIVDQVVESWNRSTGARRGWQVDVFDYSKNVAPSYGRDGQKIINEASGTADVLE